MFYFWCLSICLLFPSVTYADECDIKKCKGPVPYYQELRCKPIYEQPYDCCPVKYDCSDYYKQRNPKKCYFSGREYAIGEYLNRDSDSCGACHCSYFQDRAEFLCLLFQCADPLEGESSPNCYVGYSPENSCCGEKRCLKTMEDRFKCEVNGRTYLEGESFYPTKSRLFKCYCLEGYTGKNIEPFCRHESCGIETNWISSRESRKKCTPVYLNEDSIINGCPIWHTCEQEGDVVVIEKNYLSQSDSEEQFDSKGDTDNLCYFGNQTLHVGDTLYHERNLRSTFCMKCKCELPPVLSCVDLDNDECYSKRQI